MQFVSAAVRFNNLLDQVSAKAPFVTDAFWDRVKKDIALDLVWDGLCDSLEAGDFDNRQGWSVMMAELESTMVAYLSPAMIEIIAADARACDIHCQVAAMFDDDEQRGWLRMEALERLERHDDESARINAWRNEY